MGLLYIIKRQSVNSYVPCITFIYFLKYHFQLYMQQQI
ncbi:hypothetical protein pb186bvf_020411 [Paramecium bursaria]